MDRYAEAEQYQHDHEHTDAPWAGAGLYQWLKSARDDIAAETLSPEHTAKLEALNYSWRNSDDAFAQGLAHFAEYVAAHGGRKIVGVPPKSDDKEQTLDVTLLREWLRMQQLRFEADTLPAARIAALEDAGIDWHDEKEWQERYRQLLEYKAAHKGDVKVPHKMKPLGPWVTRQLLKHRISGTVTPKRLKMLQDAGITFFW
jgi:hypothetical protein